MKSGVLFQRLTLIATGLALCVIVLGAYVRLSDAGLGCPDWPGCYGLIDVPQGEQQIAQANESYPERPVEVEKAWKEMIHRYLAGALGLFIIALAVIAWRQRLEPQQPVLLPLTLVGLVVFQALLGMWTVTLLLKPVIVMAHLLGGLTTLALLWWLAMRHGKYLPTAPVTAQIKALRPWVLIGLLLVIMQVTLGGWTSANYAALACPDFPTCQTQWWPPMNFEEAFTLWRGIGVSYEGGILDNDARVTIHMAHRIGALLVVAYLSWLTMRIFLKTHNNLLRNTALVMALLMVVQVSLGIANVVQALPLPVAVAHNGVAALLILALVSMNHELRPRNVSV